MAESNEARLVRVVDQLASKLMEQSEGELALAAARYVYAAVTGTSDKPRSLRGLADAFRTAKEIQELFANPPKSWTE